MLKTRGRRPPGVTDSSREFRLRGDRDPAIFEPNCIGEADTTLDFGGGFVASLNMNLVVPAQTQAPGPARETGVTRFQCCIHPWTRSTVTVRSR